GKAQRPQPRRAKPATKNTAQLASGGEKWSNTWAREAAISRARTDRTKRRWLVTVIARGLVDNVAGILAERAGPRWRRRGRGERRRAAARRACAAAYHVPMIRTHDVVIVGGGLVGASLAIALDGLALDVALVEATPAGELPAVFDQRNLSLAQASVNALEALGVMASLQAPAGPIRRIHVSRAGDFGRVQLDAADYGREAFGQVVVARAFGQALEARLSRVQGLVRYRPARFAGLEDGGDGHRGLRLETGAGPLSLRTRLLVAADGTGSAVRAALGIGVRRHDYGQTLFVARVRGERPADGTAWERFTDSGPTALLPRGDRAYGVVHGVPTHEAAAV